MSNLREEFMDFHRPDSLSCEFDPSDRNKVLELLGQRIAQLQRIPKKVLAMYYCENLRPAEIATGLGLTENEIELIRTQTVRSLRNKLVDDLKQIDRST
jgi:DNA-directed RNA polymerase specialized sigma subunit